MTKDVDLFALNVTEIRTYYEDDGERLAIRFRHPEGDYTLIALPRAAVADFRMLLDHAEAQLAHKAAGGTPRARPAGRGLQ
jgi:hypothetical protein